MKYTKVYMWLQPMIMGYKPCKKKVYIHLTIEGDHTKSDHDEIDIHITGDIMSTIMFDLDIASNYDYEVIEIVELIEDDIDRDIIVEIVKSPKQIKKEQKQLVKQEKAAEKFNRNLALLESPEPLVLSKSEIKTIDGGLIKIKSKQLGLTETFNFANLWEMLEKNVLPYIAEGDLVELKDVNGNEIFTLQGGSFLNAALGDMKVYGADDQIKGCIYVRDNGDFAIGDIQRNFYLSIRTNNLFKAAVLNNVALDGFMGQKLSQSAESTTLPETLIL